MDSSLEWFFSVKSAYNRLHRDVDFSFKGMVNWKALWKLKVHDRLKFFFWRLCVGGLPLRANVSKRLPWVSSQCILCNNLVEDEVHLFFQCPLARAVWFALQWSINWSLMGFSSNLSSYVSTIINPVGVLPVSKEGSIYFGCISGA